MSTTDSSPFDLPLKAHVTQWMLFEGRRLRAGIPELHTRHFKAMAHDAEYSKTPPGAVEARLVSCLGKGAIFALHGIRGTGKTQLAVNACLWDIVRRREEDDRFQPLYVEAKRLFDTVHASRSDKASSSTDQVINRFVRASVLVIDEVQVRAQTQFEDDLLTHIIDRRYAGLRDTILLSNLKREEFGRSLGPSIVSRIHEAGEVIECNWPSFRERPALVGGRP